MKVMTPKKLLPESTDESAARLRTIYILFGIIKLSEPGYENHAPRWMTQKYRETLIKHGIIKPMQPKIFEVRK